MPFKELFECFNAVIFRMASKKYTLVARATETKIEIIGYVDKHPELKKKDVATHFSISSIVS